MVQQYTLTNHNNIIGVGSSSSTSGNNTVISNNSNVGMLARRGNIVVSSTDTLTSPIFIHSYIHNNNNNNSQTIIDKGTTINGDNNSISKDEAITIDILGTSNNSGSNTKDSSNNVICNSNNSSSNSIKLYNNDCSSNSGSGQDLNKLCDGLDEDEDEYHTLLRSHNQKLQREQENNNKHQEQQELLEQQQIQQQQQQQQLIQQESEGGSSVSMALTFMSCMIVIFICIFYFSKNLISFLEMVESLGLIGNLIFILSYLPTGIPLALFSIYIPLTLSSGFVYGFLHGIITVAIGSALSASFGFWLTRKASIRWFETKIQSSPKLSALRSMVEHHPFKIIIIMRLLPIPFGLQNGLCAMTRISYTTFIYSSVIGLIPENCLFVYFGTTLKNLSDITNSSRGQQSLLIIAIIIGILLIIVGKRALNSPSSLFSMPRPTITLNNLENPELIKQSPAEIILTIKSTTTTTTSIPKHDIISGNSSSSSSSSMMESPNVKLHNNAINRQGSTLSKIK